MAVEMRRQGKKGLGLARLAKPFAKEPCITVSQHCDIAFGIRNESQEKNKEVRSFLHEFDANLR